jgi:hemoglobin
MTETPQYGDGNATFQACGGEVGIRNLVDAFYDLMTTEEKFANLRSMHPSDLAISRDKLARFLCGWTGGPRLYTEKYGSITIPGAHAHLRVTATERDQWLTCMASALALQPYPESLVKYLLAQLWVPAERIREACSKNDISRT